MILLPNSGVFVEFQEAIELHLGWKHRFFSALRSEKRDTLDPRMLGSTEICSLGQWIEGHVAQGSTDHLFARLRVEHQQFHRLAASLMEPGLEDYTPTQIMLMEGHMQELSDQVVETLGLLNLRGKNFPPTSLPE